MQLRAKHPSIKSLSNHIIRKICRLSIANYAYDRRRFLAAYADDRLIKNMNYEQAASHLLRLMHSIEKGLALPSPRPGFGINKAVILLNSARVYKERFGNDQIYQLCMAVIANYREFQQRNGFPLQELSLNETQPQERKATAGARETTREEIWRDSRIDFKRFAKSRSSIRMFTGDPIPGEDIIDAISIASKSPSVCNRACARAFYTTDKKLIGEILERQGGNKGFGHLAAAVIMVTADMRAFHNIGERNQGWIDGGLFAMSLNYALHAKGYGVCMLNWSADMLKDFRFRRKYKIPNEQAIIMMMAIGHIPDRLMVAVSPRRDVSNFAIRFERLFE